MFPSNLELAGCLGVTERTPVYRHEKLVFADADPVSLHRLYLPEPLAETLRTDLSEDFIFRLLDKHGITITSGGNVLDVLKAMKAMNLDGMVGGLYYYYEIPKNPVNEWLVREHQKRFNAPPDFFTCGGFAAAMAVVTGIQKAGGTDTEKLIAAMAGLEFQTPKGRMVFRKDDQQALQSMYAFRMVSKPDVPWLVPELTRELGPEETAPPIMNKR